MTSSFIQRSAAQTEQQLLGQPPEKVLPGPAQSNTAATRKVAKKQGKRGPSSAETKQVLTLLGRGRLADVERLTRSLVTRFPLHGFGWKVMGAVLHVQGKNEEALPYLIEATKLMPDDAETHYNLGTAFQIQKRYKESEVCLRQAVALDPDNAKAYGNLATVLTTFSCFTEAIECFQRASKLDPAFDSVAYSNLLFCLSHDVWTDAQQLHAAHLAFGEQYEGPLRSGWQAHNNVKDPERCLQVGIVSGDLYSHAVASLLEPVLEFLAKKPDLSLHAFYTNTIQDVVTQRLHSYFAHWHAVSKLDATELSKNIRATGIDILIDLSGHTDKNRLLTFARKPAPVQVSWMGYPGTTGLQAIDYYLCDRFWVPPGEKDWQFTEKPAYLPVAITFQPDENAPPVNTLPALENGYVTFGSFNRASKLNDSVVVLWSLLLTRNPKAKLLLGGLAQDAQVRLSQQFEREGINQGRLVFCPRSNIVDYLSYHHQVDICLDAFPYGGGTTTLHAAWMAVPTLTLLGETPPSRVGPLLMNQIGLEGFIAKSIEDFLDKGTYWANHIAELAKIRLEMRARFKASALGQPATFANSFEAILRIMWQRWCNGLPPAAIEVTASQTAGGTQALTDCGQLAQLQAS